MSKAKRRLRARTGMDYPVGECVALVYGKGKRNLTPEELESCTFKRVEAGDFCDDLPKQPREAWLRRGRIEWVSMVLGSLNAKDAAKLVRGADAGDLDALEAEELAGQNRKTVLDAIEARREEREGDN